jgi:3-hydroxyisobutyrate dehydrogenase-like beta-hydroxyacid dehydrogenase
MDVTRPIPTNSPFTRLPVDIGFIGLGSMGMGVAANLVRAGHHVRVWNRSRGPVDQLARLGAHGVATARDAFTGDAVLSMLPSDDVIRSVIIDGRLIAEAPRGLVHANLATISVALARELAELHRAHGIGYVAAPVFGRPDVAAAGTLHVVAAGDSAAIARVQPLLDTIGQKTWPVGAEPHRANVVKIAGNFMIASAIETMGEAAAMAEGYGVTPAELLDVLTNTVFPAPVYKNYAGIIASQRYEPAGFRLALGLKDVRLALEAADAVNTPLPFASVLRDNLLEAVAHGQSEHDWSAVAEVARWHAGHEGRHASKPAP